LDETCHVVYILMDSLAWGLDPAPQVVRRDQGRGARLDLRQENRHSRGLRRGKRERIEDSMLQGGAGTDGPMHKHILHGLSPSSMVADEVRGQGSIGSKSGNSSSTASMISIRPSTRPDAKSLGVDERLRRSLGQVTLLWQLFHWCAGCENLGDGQVIGVAEQLEYV
jgi:hypothetical protein